MRAAASEAFAIDPHTADALLDGRVAADDAPPGYGAVVTVLQASTAPIRPDEIAAAPDAIRRIFEEARRPPAPAPHASGADTRRLVGRWSARAVVVAVVALFTVGGGVALAATGSLPGPLQSAASRALEVVGIDVPDGADSDPAPSDDPGSDPAAGPSSGAPSDSTTTTTTTPTTSSPANAPTTGDVPTTPAPPTTDVTSGVPGQGDEVCAEASDGICRAGEPHPSDSRPEAPEPTSPPTTEEDEAGREKKDKKDKKDKDNPSVTAPGQTKTAGPPVAAPSASRG